jgi:hypothetical protein
MSPIPAKLKKEILADPYYQKCARADYFCRGRITWEHAFLYAGKQIQEKWAIIPLCIFHHLDEGLNKGENQLIALSRATTEDLSKYPNVEWAKLQQRLKYERVRGTKEHLTVPSN